MASADAIQAEIQAAHEAALTTAKTTAVAQAATAPGGFSLAGHPAQEYNCVYRPERTHKGWPRFKSDNGMHLYYYEANQQWLVSPAFTPEKGNCAGWISSVAGELPLGARAWQIGPSLHKSGSGVWEERQVTVTALPS